MRLEELVNKNYQSLNENDLYIWNYIIHHRKECERLSIDDLASRCNVSRSTILRFSKRLGLKGYAELKVFLRIDNHMTDKSATADNMYNVYVDILKQYREYNYRGIVESIYNAKNLYVFGTGVFQSTSAQHFKRAFSLAGKIFLDIDRSADFSAYTNLLQPGDVFVAISYSGENRHLLDYINQLKLKGVIIVAITSNKECTLSHEADYSLQAKVYSVMSTTGRLEDLPGNYYILIDFLVAYYMEYAKRRGDQ